MIRAILSGLCRSERTVATIAPGEVIRIADRPRPAPAAAIAAIEAADFVAADEAPCVDRFALIALALDSAVVRDREGLAMIEAIEANPKAHGRSHGLEWAYEQLFLDADRLRQAAALMRALAPHEATIRAILHASHASAAGAAREFRS